jgi:UTP--glucose-1-phosphate uridylyltransferase
MEENMIKKAVLLCGGLATRLLPITKSIPKEMMPILNRPAIDYCIEDLKNNGIKEILIVLGRNKESIETYYDRNIELENRLKIENKEHELNLISSQHKDINITYIRQIEPKGTGYATKLAKTFVDNESFILLFPDDIIIENSLCKQLLDTYNKTKCSVIPLKEINIQDCTKYGMVGINPYSTDLQITDFIEKPSIATSPSNICYTGGGLFTSEIFDLIDKCTEQKNGEILLTDTFKYLIQQNKLFGTIIKGTRLDLGTPIGLLKSNILAGLKDNNTKSELADFLKSLEI